MKAEMFVNNGGNETVALDGNIVTPGSFRDSGPIPACRYIARDQNTRRRWDKQVKTVVMECYYLSNQVNVCMMNGEKEDWFDSQNKTYVIKLEKYDKVFGCQK